MSLISSFLILTRGLRVRLKQPFHFHFRAKIPPPWGLFSDTFPGDGQPQAAIQTAPPINSRTGKQSSIATNEQPRRVITTDAHARIIAPPRQRGNSKNNSCGGGRSGTTTTTHWRRFRTTPRRDSGTQRATLQHDPGNDQAEDFDQPQ